MKRTNIKECIGKEYGKLTILQEDCRKSGRRQVLCRCSCGKEKIIRFDSVISGNIKSCGCLTVGAVIENLIGKKFNFLTVIDFYDNCRKWLCRCDCGKTVIVRGDTLKANKTKSCGCYKPTKKNLEGMKVGRLLVIKEAPKNNRRTMWVCKCDCGNIVTIRTNHLSGKDKYLTKSCGCITKEHNLKHQLAFGESSFNRLFRTYQREGNGRRNVGFQLTKEQFRYLTQLPCKYCGSLPASILTGKTHYGYYQYNGIDRVDSKIGYQIDNCVPCCITCNRMKLDHPIDFFKKQIEKIYLNLRAKNEL